VPWPLHTSSVVCHHSVIVHNMTCAMSFVDFFFFFFFLLLQLLHIAIIAAYML